MPHRQALREQFSISGDTVLHVPTSAYWTAHPGDPHLAALFMGRLGEPLENGEEYDRREAHEVALSLLEERIWRR